MSDAELIVDTLNTLISYGYFVTVGLTDGYYAAECSNGRQTFTGVGDTWQEALRDAADKWSKSVLA